MLYDYLDEFLVVAHSGTLSGAAGTLGVSQPSLGRHLSALETSLGARLLERGPSGVTLTDAGRRALACAEEIAGLEASLVTHFRDPERRLRERVLAVAASCLDEYTRRLLDKTCARLTEEGYAVRLEVSKLPADEDPAHLLADRDIDAAICLRAQAAGAGANGCFEEDLYRMGAGVIVHAASAPEGPLALEDVLDWVFTLGREPGQHALWDEFLRICDSRGLPAPAMRAPRRAASTGASQPMRPGDVRLSACDPLHPATPAEGERAVPVSDLSFEVVMLGRTEDDVVRRAARIAREIAQATGAPKPADQPSMYVALPKTPMSVGALTFAEQGEYLARVLDEPHVETDLVLPDGTVVDKVYVALRNRLNRIGDGLSGDPVPTSYDAIMRLWSREDAEAYLEMPLLEAFTAYDFAESSGRSVEECERILENLSSRSLVFRQIRGGVPQYFLLAWTYGVWEFMVSDYDKGFLDWGIYGYDLGSASQFPTMRACPIGPETLAEGATLSPYWDWRSFIMRQDLIATAPCQCQLSNELVAGSRNEGGSEGQSENANGSGNGAACRRVPGPQRGLCITLGDMARYWIDNGNGRQISREECLERATEAIYQRGCVPQAIYTKNPEVVCFCDVSYCHVISAIRTTCGAAPSMQLSSAYRLLVDQSRCTGCGACEETCPMQAIRVGEDGAVTVGPMCLSCGHCTLACTAGALSLTPKERGAEARLPQDLLEDYRWRSEDRMARGYITDFTQGRIDPLAAM